MLDGFGVHAEMLKQIEDNARVEGPRARAHDETVDRREAHGGGDAAAVVDGAQAGAIAEVRDDRLAACAVRCDLPQSGDDVLIGKAMEAVAPYSFLRQIARQAETAGQLGFVRMEGRIETGDLSQAW